MMSWLLTSLVIYDLRSLSLSLSYICICLSVCVCLSVFAVLQEQAEHCCVGFP